MITQFSDLPLAIIGLAIVYFSVFAIRTGRYPTMGGGFLKEENPHLFVAYTIGSAVFGIGLILIWAFVLSPAG